MVVNPPPPAHLLGYIIQGTACFRIPCRAVFSVYACHNNVEKLKKRSPPPSPSICKELEIKFNLFLFELDIVVHCAPLLEVILTFLFPGEVRVGVVLEFSLANKDPSPHPPAPNLGQHIAVCSTTTIKIPNLLFILQNEIRAF